MLFPWMWNEIYRTLWEVQKRFEYPPLQCTSTRELKKKSVDRELLYVLGSHVSRCLVHHQYYQLNYELTNPNRLAKQITLLLLSIYCQISKKRVDLSKHQQELLPIRRRYFKRKEAYLSSRKENDTSVISHKENSYYLSSLIWNFSQWNKPCGPVVMHNILLHSSTQNSSMYPVNYDADQTILWKLETWCAEPHKKTYLLEDDYMRLKH
jgi:hypothetical protein